MEKFDLESLASAVVMRKTRAESNVNATNVSNDAIDCGPEIPIVVINGNKSALIWSSSKGKHIDFTWHLYPQVSDTKVKTPYGFDTTLKNVFADVSRPKQANATLQYRPVPSIVQGGDTTYQPDTNQPIANQIDDINSNSVTDNSGGSVSKKCENLCADAIVVNRLRFPIFSANTAK